MCIAIVKPKNVEIPDRASFLNCFNNNPDGAGFMFVRNNQLHIKKGYMSFEDFYTAFCSENFTEQDTIFIHFRIATHGLRDGGNTHPFPITNSISDLRKKNISFNGYGLIHNGILHYPKFTFKKYDPTGTISDTMLFTLKMFEELNDTYINSNNEKSLWEYLINDSPNKNLEFMIKETINGSTKYQKQISREIGYNKIAILKDDGIWKIFGNWINNNGVFYSNHDYEDNWRTKINMLGFTRGSKIHKELSTCCICDERFDDYGGITIGKKDFCWNCYDEYGIDSLPISKQFFTCDECNKEYHNSLLIEDVNKKICCDCLLLRQKK